MTATLKMKDAKGKAAAIKKASDAFNNAETVKQAKPVYIAAVQAANNQFQTDQKACLASSGLKTLGTGIFKNIKVGFSSSMSSVTKFFTGKK